MEDLFELGKENEGLLYTVVYSPNSPSNPDHQAEWIDESELRAAAHSYLKSGKVKLNHRQILSPGRARVVESYVTTSDTTVAGKTVRKGSWVAVFKIEDDRIRSMIRSGELKGVSLAGVGRKSELGGLSRLEISEISLVTSPASGLPFLALKSDSDTESEELQARIRADLDSCWQLLTVQKERDRELKSALTPENLMEWATTLANAKVAARLKASGKLPKTEPRKEFGATWRGPRGRRTRHINF